MNKATKIAAWAGLLLGLGLLLLGGSQRQGVLGGSVLEVMQTDFVNGLKVAGDLVLSADALSIADGTFSDDVTVTDDLSVAGDTVVDQFTQGGAVLATTTGVASVPLDDSELADYNILDVTPNVNLTLTLPATSTWTTIIPTAGDYRSWVIRNASTSVDGTANITVAAGTGIDLQEPDGQNVVVSRTNFAWLTCYRKTDTDVVCLVDESIPAD